MARLTKAQAVRTGRITRARKTPPAVNANAIIEAVETEDKVYGNPPAWAEVSSLGTSSWQGS